MDLRDITLVDGRTLEVGESGPQGGPVLLFHHGTPGAVTQDRHFARAVHERGWRLVTYSRAGYGGSSRNPGRTVADVVPDMRQLLDAIGAERAYIAGASGGGPHTLACAALMTDRCTAALSIASVGPYGAVDLDFLAGMGEDNLDEFGAALAGEAALRDYLDAQVPALRTADPETIIAEMATLLPEVDRASMSGELGEDLAESFHHGLGTSVDGWLDDDLAFIQPWGFELEAVAAPVSLWQGDQDLMVPFEHGRWLGARVPGVQLHLELGEGHLSLAVGAVDRMLDDLERMGAGRG